METADYGIENNYVIANKYSAIAEHSKRRNILYDNYLEIFEKIFISYRQFYEETQELFKQKLHEKSIYITELKNFLRKYSEIIKDTAIFQVDCITEIRANKQEVISKYLADITPKVESCGKHQKLYKYKQEQIVEKRKQVKKLYENLKNQSKQIQVFYNAKHMKSKAKQIIDKLNEIKQLENQVEKIKVQIHSASEEFQEKLINFRKKLLQNKYSMLNCMIEQSKNFRAIITEVLLLLVQCVNSKMDIFVGLVKNPKEDTISMTQSKGRRKGEDIQTSISNLVNSIHEYNYLIDQILAIIKGLDTALKRNTTKVQQIIESSKKYFIDNLNGIYSIQQTPSKQVDETLDLYSYYAVKTSLISDKLYQCSNKLTELKQKVKKHADVTLSLARSNSRAKDEGKAPQLDQVYNQISYDFVTQVILEVYKSFKQVLMGVKSYFSQKYYKKKKVRLNDSMQISHVDETIIAQKKKPCKQEMWLWRDWRDKNSFVTNSSSFPTVNMKQIDQFLSSVKFEDQSKEIAKFQCTFSGKKDMKGILKICEKSLQFLTHTNATNIYLSLAYSDLNEVNLKVKTTEKIILIETDKGELTFYKFYDPQQVEKIIKDQRDKANKEKGKISKKQAVQLLPQEIQYIQANRTKINEQRPTSEGMIKIKSIFVDNITTDLVYEYIYSDKPFTLRGKPEDNFFAYCQKKAKNFNYISQPYDKPGPQFYSRVPQVKFTNCPLYSTRIFEYDHPMPPIPFMPKSCHCKQVCNIYWLSNESFDYFVLSQSSQAPYADTFVVKILHRVWRQGTGVKIELSGGLFFVKDTAMKGMLKSKGQNQMIEASMFTMGQLQKSLNIVSGNCNQEQKQNTKEAKEEQSGTQKETKKGQQQNQLEKLKNQKKLLIIAIVIVFLFNLLRIVIS